MVNPKSRLEGAWMQLTDRIAKAQMLIKFPLSLYIFFFFWFCFIFFLSIYDAESQ